MEITISNLEDGTYRGSVYLVINLSVLIYFFSFGTHRPSLLCTVLLYCIMIFWCVCGRRDMAHYESCHSISLPKL